MNSISKKLSKLSPSIRRVMTFFVAWRIGLLFLVLFVAPHVEQNTNQLYVIFAEYAKNTSQVFQLVHPFANFDGIHYLTIAADGYTTEARFLPLLPVTLRLLFLVTNIWQSTSAIQVIVATTLATLLGLSAVFSFYKLLLLDFDSQQAKKTIFSMLAFPTSFFLVAVYPESLFLLLSFASLYCARKQRWVLASVLSALLTVTRLQGVLLIPVLLFEWWYQNRKVHKDFRIPALITSSIAPFLGYAYFNLQKWGTAFYFITAHTELGNSRQVNSFIFIGQTIFRYLKIFFTVSPTIYEWWIALLELSMVLLVAVGLYGAFKLKVRPTYLLFGLLLFSVPVISGTFSGFPRYALLVFPIFIFTSTLKKPYYQLYLAVGLLLQAILLIYFVQGYFIA